MKRLTKFVDGKWIENHDHDERKGWKNGNRACMCKLAAYEDIGTPEEFRKLKQANRSDPLTVEELRQMDGEPVYTVTGLHLPCPNDEWWAIMHIVPDSNTVHFYGSARGRSVSLDEYGKTWLAYRCKPEGETE